MEPTDIGDDEISSDNKKNSGGGMGDDFEDR